MHAVVVRSFLEVSVPGDLGDACRRQSYRSHKTCSVWLPEALDGQRHLGRAESFLDWRVALAGKVINLTG